MSRAEVNTRLIADLVHIVKELMASSVPLYGHDGRWNKAMSLAEKVLAGLDEQPPQPKGES